MSFDLGSLCATEITFGHPFCSQLSIDFYYYKGREKSIWENIRKASFPLSVGHGCV